MYLRGSGHYTILHNNFVITTFLYETSGVKPSFSKIKRKVLFLLFSPVLDKKKAPLLAVETKVQSSWGNISPSSIPNSSIVLREATSQFILYPSIRGPPGTGVGEQAKGQPS